jgi:ribonuclease III
VEGGVAGADDLPAVPLAQAVARGLSDVRDVRFGGLPAPGPRGLIEAPPVEEHCGEGELVTAKQHPSLDLLESRLGIGVAPTLLDRALTHRSYAYENGGLPTNERLEFLGDSVLGLIVTATLYHGHPDVSEGQLAKLRAAVVNMRALAEVGRVLDLGQFIRLGRGEETTGGRDKDSILADTLEAVIGAVYLDRGLVQAESLVHRLFDDLINRSATLGAGLDWKTSLQELTADKGLGVPDYVVEESGPDHAKRFVAKARVGGVEHGRGDGRSKKEAEQKAAEMAWRAIRERFGDGVETPIPAGGAEVATLDQDRGRVVEAQPGAGSADPPAGQPDEVPDDPQGDASGEQPDDKLNDRPAAGPTAGSADPAA